MSQTPTIDTAIAAWRRAETQSDRDLAAEAIGQHIAHQTPEGGDYVAATSELLERLKAEFGPVPVEDIRGPGVYEGDTRLDADATLPSVFVYRDGAGGETRYWYQGQETYEVHDYDQDRQQWIGRGTTRLDDDATVEDFLAVRDAA